MGRCTQDVHDACVHIVYMHTNIYSLRRGGGLFAGAVSWRIVELGLGEIENGKMYTRCTQDVHDACVHLVYMHTTSDLCRQPLPLGSWRMVELGLRWREWGKCIHKAYAGL